MKEIKLALFALIILATSISSNALTVSKLEEEGNSNSSVEAVNLEWLKWTETVGMSIEDALNEYANDGWRLATNSDMAKLFNEYFLEDEDGNTINTITLVTHDPFGMRSASEFSTDENLSQHSSVSETWINPLLFDFFEAFGIIDDFCGPLDMDHIFCMTSTSALFGSDLDDDGLFNRAKAFYDYNDNYGEVSIGEISSDAYPISLGIPSPEQPAYHELGAGVALVRSLPYNPAPVPEIDVGRSALAFFLLAGMLFWFREQLPIKSIRN